MQKITIDVGSMHNFADSKELQQLTLSYRNLGPMLAVNLAAIVAVYFGLRPHLDLPVAIWSGMHASIVITRAAIWMTFQIQRPRGFGPSVFFWQFAYRAGLLLSGAMWSGLCIYVFGSDIGRAFGPESYLLIIVISGLAGGASGVTSAHLQSGTAYITCLLVPASLCLIGRTPTEQSLGMLGLVFWLVMIMTLRGNNRVLIRNLSLEQSNMRLIDRLKNTNEELETKVMERTAKLAQTALTDALTGLANRNGLLDWFNRHVPAEDDKIAVFFLDLDRFKQINDALGHDAGDKVLATVAHQIHSVIPADAKLARWGGDEFVLACPYGGAPDLLVSTIAQRVSRAVDLPLSIDGASLKLGVSIGWSSFPDDHKTFSDVIHAADLAATEVKRNGRGDVLAFSETFAENLRRRFDLSRSLASAIGTDALSLVYQPIVDAASGKVTAYEALCRWEHPDLGVIRPDEFIRLAEDTDRIVVLGNWVLLRACEDAARWRRKGNAASVAVNVSIKQLISHSFALHMAGCLADTGLPPSMVEIEVTESVFDDDHIDQVAKVLSALKALGVSVHIDDFGTGYSSLSRLRRLEVDAIKIDRSFVADLTGQSQVIIESTLLIARAFDLKVVAEGVETSAQRATLAALGVHYMQGYLFGKPLPLHALLDPGALKPPRARRSAALK